MAQAARLNLRMQKELKLLLTDPPPGVSLPMLTDETTELSLIHAQIQGPEGTVYANGVFSIKIQIPDRYPFQPPNVTFATPIYHPNIDNGGRICLDILNLPPKGAWQPSLNISTVLTSIGLLLSEPNPDDGLMCEASQEYKYNRQTFDQKAWSMTEKYAKANPSGNCSGSSSTPVNQNLSMMEAERLDVVSSNVDTKNNESHKKLNVVSRKLSLVSSGPSHGCNGDEKNNVQNLSMQSSKSLPTTLVDSHVGQPTHQDDVGEAGKISINVSEEKPCDIGHKVSLESSGPPVVDNLFHQHPYTDCEGNDKEGCINLSHKQLSGIGPKLSVGSSCSAHKKNGDDKENVLQTTKLSLLQSQSLSLASSKSSVMPQGSSYGREQPHHHIQKAGKGTLKTSNKKPFGIRKKATMDISDQFKTGDDDNKENVPPNYQLTTPRSHFTTSTNSIKMPQAGIYDGKQSHADDDLGAGNENITVTHKKFCGLGRKLSLGFSEASSKSRDNTNMENVLPIQKSIPHSQSFPAVPTKPMPVPNVDRHEQSHQNCVEKAKNGNTPTNEEEATSIHEAVIVLDSEDSEEEATGPIRSRLSLARRRLAGKRKVNE